MNLMDQKQLWKALWNKKSSQEANPCAKTTFEKIPGSPWTHLLVLGCGDGADSLFFAKKGFHVTAVDFSETGIERLKKRAAEQKLDRIQTISSDLQKLDFEEEVFDVIYAHLSLHYFNDEQTTKLFERIFYWLKKDGLFFLKCKSLEDLLYGQGKEIEKDMYEYKEHVRHFFSESYLRQKLDKFDILSIKSSSDQYHGHKSHFVEGVGRKKNP